MVIGFLERRFLARSGGVVLVRRIARPMPAGRDHLDHQQAFGRLRFPAGCCGRSAGWCPGREPRATSAPGRRCAALRRRRIPGAEPIASSTRVRAVTSIATCPPARTLRPARHRRTRFRGRRHCRTTASPTAMSAVPLRTTRQASRPASPPSNDFARVELHDLEADMRPAGDCRRDFQDGAVGFRRVGADASVMLPPSARPRRPRGEACRSPSSRIIPRIGHLRGPARPR